MRPKGRRVGLWLLLALGAWLLYYLGASVWGYVSAVRERARLERELLHMRAKTAAF